MKPNNTHPRLLLTAACCLLILPVTADSLQRRELRLDQCPATVRETILQNARNGTIEEVEQIRFASETLYVADVEQSNGTDLEIHVGASGKLIETREDITGKELPAAVLNRLNTFEGKASDFERHIKEGKTTYEAELDRNGRPDLLIRLDEAGNLLEETEEYDD